MTYSREPETWAYGGVRIGNGQAVTLCAPSRNSASCQDFLARLEQTSPTGTTAVIRHWIFRERRRAMRFGT